MPRFRREDSFNGVSLSEGLSNLEEYKDIIRNQNRQRKESAKSLKDYNQKPKKNEKAEKQDEEINTVKGAIKNWCSNTTCHGFGNIVATDSWIIRIAWILVLIVSMAYCVYTIQQSIRSYLDYEVIISYNSYIETPTQFPAVTICNMNAFDVAGAADTSDYINNALISQNIQPNIELDDDQTAFEAITDAIDSLKASITANTSINDTAKKDMGFTLSKMLVSCYFNGANCSVDDFKYSRTHEYGNCYTYNYDPENPIYTSRTGPSSGLTIELYVGSTSSRYYTVTAGAYVMIHNQSVTPLTRYEGISLEIGTASSVSVDRTFYTRLSDQYSDCRKDLTPVSTDSEYYKITASMTQYYQKFCYEICFQYEFVIKHCGCADPSIPIYDSSVSICTNLTCVKQYRNYFDSASMCDTCDVFCPLECDSASYRTSISVSSYPTTYYSNILGTQSGLSDTFTDQHSFSMSSWTPGSGVSGGGSPSGPSGPIGRKRRDIVTNDIEEIKSRSKRQASGGGAVHQVPQTDIESCMLMFTIYYQDIRYTSIEEEPAITIETLTGVVGGQFGLFLGASFLSFAEMIELLVNIVKIVTNRRNARRIEAEKKLRNRNLKSLTAPTPPPPPVYSRNGYDEFHNKAARRPSRY